MSTTTSSRIPPQRGAAAEGAEHALCRSYMRMAVVVGVLGMVLPLLIVFVDWLALTIEDGRVPTDVRSSMSAYYYSGARDAFVGTLCTLGVFLIFFHVGSSLQNHLCTAAGLAAIGVAAFPTGAPDGWTDSPAVHAALERLPFVDAGAGADWSARLHGTSAIALFVCLALICFTFASRTDHALVRRTHAALGSAIILAGVTAAWMTISTAGTERLPDIVYYTELACILLFGASWLLKAWQLRSPSGGAVEPFPAAPPSTSSTVAMAPR